MVSNSNGGDSLKGLRYDRADCQMSVDNIYALV